MNSKCLTNAHFFHHIGTTKLVLVILIAWPAANVEPLINEQQMVLACTEI
jgi:hypothetical protein